VQNRVVVETAEIFRRLFLGDIALLRAIHARVHNIETPREIGERAAAVRQQDTQLGEAIHHAGENERADGKGRVDGVLRDLGQRELRYTWLRLCLNRMNEYGDVEIDRGLPERIEVELAEIDPLDIGGDDGADGAESIHRMGQFGRRFLRVGKRHRRKHGESLRLGLTKLSHVLVHVTMPSDGPFARQAMRENIGPHRQHLPVDALLIHSLATRFNGLDQPLEERADLETIVEVQGTCA